MSYKSKHTGAQVDEAVSKVLNGEVGGGADWNANWNAQEGEAGYIENKPFGFNITETYNYKKDEGAYDGYIDIQMFSFSPNYDEEKGCYIFPDVEMTGNADGGYRYYLGTLFNLPTYAGYFDDSGEHWISAESQVDYSYEGLWLEDSDGGGQSNYYLHLRLWVGQINYDINVNVGHITQMSEKYLTDKVLKTTPQLLSTKDKNQALANLGIDPVVWKYMCRPLPINNQDYCPEELLDEQGNLKYQIPSMYIVHHNGEYCGPVSWISERNMGTFYINGSYFEVNLDDSGTFTITEMTN